jgi:hypothetical protein
MICADRAETGASKSSAGEQPRSGRSRHDLALRPGSRTARAAAGCVEAPASDPEGCKSFGQLSPGPTVIAVEIAGGGSYETRPPFRPTIDLSAPFVSSGAEIVVVVSSRETSLPTSQPTKCL